MQSIDKKKIRRTMRQKRRALSTYQQKQAAKGLVLSLKTSNLFNRCNHVAIYLANDGEIDPAPFIEQLWKSKKHCYLPVLHPIKKNCLWFYQYNKKTKLASNRFGILEPELKNKRRISPWALDLVLFPLVAFDSKGGRLGMGGGFYDRTFEFAQQKTKLYGLAHHFQEVSKLPTEPWDIPLHGIVTDKKLFQT